MVLKGLTFNLFIPVDTLNRPYSLNYKKHPKLMSYYDKEINAREGLPNLQFIFLGKNVRLLAGRPICA